MSRGHKPTQENARFTERYNFTKEEFVKFSSACKNRTVISKVAEMKALIEISTIPIYIEKFFNTKDTHNFFYIPKKLEEYKNYTEILAKIDGIVKGKKVLNLPPVEVNKMTKEQAIHYLVAFNRALKVVPSECYEGVFEHYLEGKGIEDCNNVYLGIVSSKHQKRKLAMFIYAFAVEAGFIPKKEI